MGNEEDDQKIAGIVHDITEESVSFLTTTLYANGQVLELELELPGFGRAPEEGGGLLNSAVVVTQAVVVRSETLDTGFYLLAVRFQELEKEDRVLIRRAISQVNREN